MIASSDFMIILFLAFLEGILSIDNALVLSLLARNLPREQQRKALTYGLIGAIGFRLLSLFILTYLIRLRWVKFVGGGYLIFIALKHFLFHDSTEQKTKQHAKFWPTVLSIELADAAFAVDSILAAVALSPKFWVVFTGGLLGVITMRFAALFFIKILNRFPRLEATAYILVFIIGIKIILEGLQLPGVDFHSPSYLAFWIFWGTLFISTLYGFRPLKIDRSPNSSNDPAP